MLAMVSGDAALLMWLSLNLILLVFFMLLNSMAVQGKPVDAALVPPSDVRAEMQMPDMLREQVPVASYTVWREDVVTRLRGTVLNRMTLKVLPQASNATEVQVDVPLDDVFGDDALLRRPEFVARLRQAAGPDSEMAWSLQAPYDTNGASARRMAALSRLTQSPVAWQDSDARVVRVTIRPGQVQRPQVGRDIEDVIEGVGGRVQGMDSGGGL